MRSSKYICIELKIVVIFEMIAYIYIYTGKRWQVAQSIMLVMEER
jgi:hypothetical protein